MKVPGWLQRALERVGGTVETVDGPLLDGSLVATASLPLPENHWLTREDENTPPMGLRLGEADRVSLVFQREGRKIPMVLTRNDFEHVVYQAGRYAVRAATHHGEIRDFDPDALVQHFVVGLLGPHEAPKPLDAHDRR